MAQLSGAKGRRPMVMLNACQLGRFTSRLYNVGGFTPAFMRAGAGVFIAALWSIGDSPARVFSEAFYQAFVKDGKMLAEAVKIGRAAARKSAPDTWLSYAVYGHPYARVVT
jgi:CHAT domain-containing protein